MLILTWAIHGQGQEVGIVGTEMGGEDTSPGLSDVMIPAQVVPPGSGLPLSPDHPIMVESGSATLDAPSQEDPVLHEETIEPGDNVEGGDGILIEETIEEDEVNHGRVPVEKTPLEQQLHDMYAKEGTGGHAVPKTSTTAAGKPVAPRSLTAFWIVLAAMLIVNVLLIMLLGIVTERKKRQQKRNTPATVAYVPDGRRHPAHRVCNRLDRDLEKADSSNSSR